MTRTKKVTDTARLLPRLTLAFFTRPRLTALLWITLTLFGILSYTTLLKREGFPAISIPVVIVTGSYAVNDAAQVDKNLAGPVSDIALKQKGVSSVSAQSQANFFSVTAQFDESVKADQARKDLESAVTKQLKLPSGAQLNYGAPIFGVTGGDLTKIDATIAVTADSDVATTQLVGRADDLEKYLQDNKPATVKSFSVKDPFSQVTNPLTGQQLTVQRNFDRYGVRQDGQNNFKNSVTINVEAVSGADVIKLDNDIRALLVKADKQPVANGLQTAVSASYAPAIRDQIGELQRVLLEGLLAVLIIGSIVITIRASLITVIAMVTTITATLGIVYLVGYSLNVITLFAVILGLSLIVDDTIIMVEAIDSARRRSKDRKEVVAEATRRISRAMVSATLTACLSFAPLLFVGGVLGSFIRAIPVTIISALLTSLIIALILIPFFARFILLRPKLLGAQLSKDGNDQPATRIEKRLAHGLSRPMRWASHHRKREIALGLTAVFIGLAFVAGGVLIFRNVAFNIFPPSKDTNEIAVNLTYAPGTTVAEANEIATQADQITQKTLGDNFVSAAYYGVADERSARLDVNLKPYGERDPSADDLVKDLKTQFTDFDGARVAISQVDVGPPGSALTVQIDASNRPAAEKLSADLAAFMDGRVIKRPNGTTAKLIDVSVSNTTVYERAGNRPVIKVSAGFDASDTTTLITAAQKSVTDEFTASRLNQYGLQSEDLVFDLGQESENQDSFKSLLIAFPLVLLAIYILLLIQFRSFLQPLLIFLALPFSFFGIALGLYLTHNAFSFFAMLGFFALIGLSIKNTILLTDYANQARRAGLRPVDAAAEALGERFRPLVATSLTAVVSLIPLAVTSPFWQSLAVTLICGLLSSTLLVILVFPYYYLGAEFIRIRTRRKR